MKSNCLGDVEHISALADGALSSEQFTVAIESLLSDPQAIRSWHTYHLVGDVLRSDAGSMSTDGGMGFWLRLESRLETDIVRSGDSDALGESAHALIAGGQISSANEEVFRWKMLAGVACLGLAGVLGWGVWSQTAQPQGDQFSAVQLQSPPTQTPVGASALSGVMLRDPVLDDLLAQHQRLGGHSALQIPTGFWRNATYEIPAK
jgi:sigma-E factor negative regulatory protein RseA